MALFLESVFSYIDLCVCLLPVPHCLDYCSFIVSPKSESVILSTLFLLFSYVLGNFSSLALPHTLRIMLSHVKLFCKPWIWEALDLPRRSLLECLELHCLCKPIWGQLTFLFLAVFQFVNTECLSLFRSLRFSAVSCSVGFFLSYLCGIFSCHWLGLLGHNVELEC